MSNTIVGKIVIILLIFACITILIISDFGSNKIVRYDCRDAHWHPDVPVEVKKQCQELIREQLKKSTETTI
jgi:hypothetical protein